MRSARSLVFGFFTVGSERYSVGFAEGFVEPALSLVAVFKSDVEGILNRSEKKTLGVTESLLGEDF